MTRSLITAMAATLVPACLAVSQVEVTPRGGVPAEETVNIDAISFSSSDSSRSRLDVFVLVPYNTLSFVKRGENYDASYETTLSLFDTAGMLVGEKIWTQEVIAVPFDQSVSPNMYSLSERVFSVRPGKYELHATLRDNETRGTRKRVRTVHVFDYSQAPFSLSDVLLLSRLTEKAGVKSMAPLVTANVGGISDPFFFYVEAYNRSPLDSVRLRTDVVNEKGEPLLRSDTVVALRPGRNELFLRVDHTALALGDYRLYLRAFALDADTTKPEAYAAVTDRQFSVRWQWLPRSVKDLDLAIDQIRYIAKDDEYSALKDAETPELKQKLFVEFWKRRDPNPNTPRNEKMEEYYRRAEYANKHFSHYREGWRTDMGMVYMMFGPPSDVSRHPFEVDSKPYEIWRYYDLNYDFVFVDDTGFGDYRLITPIWEAWQRVR